MYSVIHETTTEFSNLIDAMAFAKTLNRFVTIKGDDFELCGVFGASGVIDNKLPDGSEYTFFKRRDSISARKKDL